MRKYTDTQGFTALERAEGKHLPANWGSGAGILAYYIRGEGVHINHDAITEKIHVGMVPATQDDFDLIKDEGFGAVLDLCGDNPNEGDECRKRGIKFKSVRVFDTYSPTQQQFDQIVKFIKSSVEKGRKVYVHCHAGAGRAPTAVVAYLLNEGLDLRTALDTLKERRRYYAISSRQILGLTTFRNRIVGKE